MIASSCDASTRNKKPPEGSLFPTRRLKNRKPVKFMSAGPGARGDDGKVTPLDVKQGDKVLFGKWSGTEVKIDGEELLIMKESDIMGVLQG